MEKDDEEDSQISSSLPQYLASVFGWKDKQSLDNSDTTQSKQLCSISNTKEINELSPVLFDSNSHITKPNVTRDIIPDIEIHNGLETNCITIEKHVRQLSAYSCPSECCCLSECNEMIGKTVSFLVIVTQGIHNICTYTHLLYVHIQLHVHIHTHYMYIPTSCTYAYPLYVHIHAYYMYIYIPITCTYTYLLHVHIHTHYLYMYIPIICTYTYPLHVHIHTHYMYMYIPTSCTYPLHVHIHTHYMHIHTHYMYMYMYIPTSYTYPLHVHIHTNYMYIYIPTICTYTYPLHVHIHIHYMYMYIPTSCTYPLHVHIHTHYMYMYITYHYITYVRIYMKYTVL